MEDESTQHHGKDESINVEQQGQNNGNAGLYELQCMKERFFSPGVLFDPCSLMEEIIGQTGHEPERDDEVEEIMPNKQLLIAHGDSLCNDPASPAKDHSTMM